MTEHRATTAHLLTRVAADDLFSTDAWDDYGRWQTEELRIVACRYHHQREQPVSPLAPPL